MRRTTRPSSRSRLPRPRGKKVLESDLAIDNATVRWIDGECGIGDRVWASAQGPRLKLRYLARVDVIRPDVVLRKLNAAPLPALPGDVLTFVRPSRFCPSDQLASFTEKRFGHLAGADKIAAIAEWVARSLSYIAGSSHAGTTAIDTFVTREGVCRDYAHLVCALARAANIPARYSSAYGPRCQPARFSCGCGSLAGGRLAYCRCDGNEFGGKSGRDRIRARCR